MYPCDFALTEQESWESSYSRFYFFPVWVCLVPFLTENLIWMEEKIIEIYFFYMTIYIDFILYVHLCDCTGVLPSRNVCADGRDNWHLSQDL